MLKELITNILKNSDYEVDDINEQSGVLHIKLNNGNLKVSVNPTNTFNINGGKEQEKKVLEEYMRTHLRQPIREIAYKKFNEGIKEWNNWRKTHGQLSIDFSELKFSNTDFEKVNFQNIDLSYTEFVNVNLEEANFHSCELHETKFIRSNLLRSNLSFVKANLADFSYSDLSFSDLGNATFERVNLINTNLHGIKFDDINLQYANLKGADLREANLSGARINIETNFEKAKGIEKGINGYWNPDTDSAALFSEAPLGNSMKGPNIDAVLESLKRARKYFGFSFLLSLGAILLWFLKQDSTSIPVLKDFVLTKSQYLSIGMVFSLGLLVLSKSFLDDAFEGMKYLEDRSSAMAVGSFPWALTKFTGKKNDQAAISLVSRLILCLHPMLYLFAFEYTDLNIQNLVLLIIITAIGIWILFFSCKFQQPILFDQKTEDEKRNENIVAKLDQLNQTITTRLTRAIRRDR